MIEKPRILPVDPMEVARRPVEGVDIPEEADVRAVREATEGEEAPDKKPDEAIEAALRGRTA